MVAKHAKRDFVILIQHTIQSLWKYFFLKLISIQIKLIYCTCNYWNAVPSGWWTFQKVWHCCTVYNMILILLYSLYPIYTQSIQSIPVYLNCVCIFRGGTAIRGNYGGQGPIWLDDVHCNGSERSINTCVHKQWGINNCRHNEDAAVLCSIGKSFKFRSDSIQWLPSTKPHAMISTMCWALMVAIVMANMVPSDSIKISSITFSSFKFLIAFNCIKKKLLNYSIQEYFTNKNHWVFRQHLVCSLASIIAKDAKVQMYRQKFQSGMPAIVWPRWLGWVMPFMYILANVTTGLRLRGGRTHQQGRVEVQYNNQWGTVCDDMWTDSNAAVVCRALNMPT